jgi:hypothetical protein
MDCTAGHQLQTDLCGTVHAWIQGVPPLGLVFLALLIIILSQPQSVGTREYTRYAVPDRPHREWCAHKIDAATLRAPGPVRIERRRLATTVRKKFNPLMVVEKGGFSMVNSLSIA